MSGLLSLTTFAPIVGVAVILAARAFNGASEKTDTLAKWIALVTTLVTFGLSIVLTLQFDPKNPGFQFVEDVAWFAGLHYRMGIDGISVLFVLLTAFLLPICIVASWKSVEKRVVEYLIAFLVLETLVIGVFCKFCVVVDLSALVAAIAGFRLYASTETSREPPFLLWLGALVAAVGLPLSIAQLAPPSPVPDSVRGLWKPDQVNVIEFSDFECPFCRMTHPALEAALHGASDLKINFIRKTLPLPSHPNAREASRAYLCADRAPYGRARQAQIELVGCRRGR